MKIYWQPLALLLAPLTLTLAAKQQPPAVQVYLHPVPPGVASAHSAPTLSPAQAKAVLAHHLGEDVSLHEAPADDGLWAHLLHLWDGDAPARPRVVIVEGAHAQDVLPTTLREPAFYLSSHSASSVIAPYVAVAREAIENVGNLPVVKTLLDTLDLAGSKAGQALSRELAGLVALADSLWSSAETQWDAVAVRLGRVDRGSEMWETGTRGVRAGLEAMTTPGSAPVVLIIMPGATKHHGKRVLPPRAEPVCSSNATCNATGCSGHGACAEVSTDCWACSCSSGFVGVECEKTDYSTPFAILLGTSVLLAVILIGSVSLLYSVGETKLPSTLTLAVGGGHRRD